MRLLLRLIGLLALVGLAYMNWRARVFLPYFAPGILNWSMAIAGLSAYIVIRYLVWRRRPLPPSEAANKLYYGEWTWIGLKLSIAAALVAFIALWLLPGLPRTFLASDWTMFSVAIGLLGVVTGVSIAELVWWIFLRTH